MSLHKLTLAFRLFSVMRATAGVGNGGKAPQCGCGAAPPLAPHLGTAPESALKAAAESVMNDEHALLGVLKPRSMIFKVSGTNQAEAAHSRLADALGRGTRLNLETAIPVYYLELNALEKNSRKAECLLSGSTNKDSRRALQAYVQHGQGCFTVFPPQSNLVPTR